MIPWTGLHAGPLIAQTLLPNGVSINPAVSGMRKFLMIPGQ
jgi:hypothetical protein